MKFLSVEDFKDFECVGSKCPVTCCGGGWGIMIDEESGKYYETVEGPFGEKLRDSMVGEPGKYRFREEQGRCRLLDEEGLCEIYKNLGPDKMCVVCKTYPRFQYQVGDVFFGYMTTSCPEITRRILQRKEPLQVDFVDGGVMGCEKEDTDWKFFNSAIRVYTAGMDILQNRDLPILDRIKLLMLFVKQFEDNVQAKRDVDGIITIFSEPSVYKGILDSIPSGAEDYRYKMENYIFVVKYMLHATPAHSLWETLSKLTGLIAECTDCDQKYGEIWKRLQNDEDMQIEWEQLIAYRYFVMFMQGYDKKNFYEVMATECVFLTALISYTVLVEVAYQRPCLQEERIHFYSCCSRIGHNDIMEENLRKLLIQTGAMELTGLFGLLN